MTDIHSMKRVNRRVIFTTWTAVLFHFFIFSLKTGVASGKIGDQSTLISNSFWETSLSEQSPLWHSLEKDLAGKCKSSHLLGGQECSGHDPRLIIQTQLMDDYIYDMEQIHENVTAYRTVVTTVSGVLGNIPGVPVPQIQLQVRHLHEKEISVFVEENGSVRRVTLPPKRYTPFYTNARGKLTFILKPFDDQLATPIFQIRSDFIPFPLAHTFSPDISLIHSMARVTGEDLKFGKRAILGDSISSEKANEVARTIRQLASYSLQHRFSKNSDAHVPTKRRAFQKRSTGTPEEPFLSGSTWDQQSSIVDPAMIALSDNDQLYRRLIYQPGHEVDSATIVFQEKAHEEGDEVELRRFSKRDFMGFLNSGIREIRGITKKGTKRLRHIAMKAAGDVEEVFGTIHGNTKRLAQTMGMASILAVRVTTKGLEVLFENGKKMYRMVAESLDEVLRIAQEIFRRLHVVVEAIPRFFKAAFEWDDILLSTKVIHSHLKKMMSYLDDQVFLRRDEILTQATTLFNNLTDNFGETSRWIATEGRKYTIYNSKGTPPSISGAENIHQNFLRDQTVDKISAASSISGSGFMDMLKEVQYDMENIATNATEHLRNMTVGHEEMDKLRQELREIPKIFKGGISLEKFPRAIRRFVKTTRTLLRYVVNVSIQGMVGVFTAIMRVFQKIMNFRIKLPLLTDLYERIITKGREKLTLFSLISLVSAVPVTIGYKLVNDGENIFSEKEVDMLLHEKDPSSYVSSWVALDGKGSHEDLRVKIQKLSYVIGSCFSVSNFIVDTLIVIDGDILGDLFLQTIRLPFFFTRSLSQFPFLWYYGVVEAHRSEVALVNVKFIAWFFSFMPMLTGFSGIHRPGLESMAISTFRVLKVVAVTCPLLYLIFQSVTFEQAFFQGPDKVDAHLRVIAHLLSYTPDFLSLANTPVLSKISLSAYYMASLIDLSRLQLAMSSDAIYSV